MPNPNTAHSSLNAKDFNYMLFILIILAYIGILYQQWFSVKAGLIYGTLIIGTIVMAVVLTQLFLKDDRSMKPISDYVKIPISTKLSLAVLSSLIGFITPFLLSPIIKVITGFSITSLAVPLFGGGGTFQSFAVASIETSVTWQLFNISFTAGVIETFVYSFLAVIIGIMLGLGILKLLLKEGQKPSKFWIMSIALIFSVGAFVFSHTLNGTYSGGMFVIAGLFLLISNLSIYFGGFFLLFWIFYHISNNLIYLIEKLGFAVVLQGFVSWFGLIFVSLLSLMIFYILNNWDVIVRDLKQWLKG